MLQSSLKFSTGWKKEVKRERSRGVSQEKRENDYIKMINLITITNEKEKHNIYKALKRMTSMLTKLYNNAI